MTLIILQDRDDVTRATDVPGALAGELLAWDLPAHLELQDRSLPHLTPWDFVSADDRDAVRRFESAAQAFWRDHAHIPFAGLDLLAIARFRHVACLARLAWSAWVIQRALELLAPETLFVFDEPPAHGLDQPADCPRMPLLNPLARGIAESRGIAVQPIARDAATFQDQAANQARASGGPAIDLASELAGEPYVAFCGSGIDLLRQLPLIRALREQPGLAVVQIYRAADALTLRTLASAGHRVYHESQLTTEAHGVDDAALSTAHSAWNYTVAHLTDRDLAAVFANPHLRPHFDFIFGDYARRLAAQAGFWRTLFERCPPQAVVSNYPTVALEVAGQLDVPGMLLCHGVMTAGDTRWYTCLPPVTIGAASTAHRDRLLRAGIPADRIRITGDPGLDATLADARRSHPLPSPDGPRRILLITSAIAAPAHQSDLPQINWRTAVDTFADLNRLARRRPDWQFSIRPHPRYDQPELYAHLQRFTPPERRWRTDPHLRLADAVRAADAVVVVNNRSSAIVEASLLPTPVLLLCPDMTSRDLADWGLANWPTLASVEALERELTALFTDPVRREQRTAQSRSAVHQFLGEPPQSAAPRAAEEIENLITTRAPA